MLKLYSSTIILTYKVRVVPLSARKNYSSIIFAEFRSNYLFRFFFAEPIGPKKSTNPASQMWGNSLFSSVPPFSNVDKVWDQSIVLKMIEEERIKKETLARNALIGDSEVMSSLLKICLGL